MAMADSMLMLDTSLSDSNDDEDGIDVSEGEYDAINEETFGHESSVSEVESVQPTNNQMPRSGKYLEKQLSYADVSKANSHTSGIQVVSHTTPRTIFEIEETDWEITHEQLAHKYESSRTQRLKQAKNEISNLQSESVSEVESDQTNSQKPCSGKFIEKRLSYADVSKANSSTSGIQVVSHTTPRTNFEIEETDWEITHEQLAHKYESSRTQRHKQAKNEISNLESETTPSQLVVDEIDSACHTLGSSVWRRDPPVKSPAMKLEKLRTVKEIEQQIIQKPQDSSDNKTFIQRPLENQILQKRPEQLTDNMSQITQPLTNILNQNPQINQMGQNNHFGQMGQLQNHYGQNNMPITQNMYPSNQMIQHNMGINQMNQNCNQIAQNTIQMSQKMLQGINTNHMGQMYHFNHNVNQLNQNTNQNGQYMNQICQYMNPHQIGQSWNQMGHSMNPIGPNVNPMCHTYNHMPCLDNFGQNQNLMHQFPHFMMGQNRPMPPPPGMNNPRQNLNPHKEQFNFNFRDKIPQRNEQQQPNMNHSSNKSKFKHQESKQLHHDAHQIDENNHMSQDANALIKPSQTLDQTNENMDQTIQNTDHTSQNMNQSDQSMDQTNLNMIPIKQNMSLMNQEMGQSLHNSFIWPNKSLKAEKKKLTRILYSNSKENSLTSHNLLQIIQKAYPMLQLNDTVYNMADSLLFSRDKYFKSDHPMLNNLKQSNNSSFKCFNNNTKIRSITNSDDGSDNDNGNESDNGNDSDSDKYLGQVSEKEKQWLINIQILKSENGTPFILDFNCTEHSEREVQKEKEVKETHKLTLQNCHTNSNDVSQESLRRESDNSTTKEPAPRAYDSAQFKNSLGKPQDQETISETSSRHISTSTSKTEKTIPTQYRHDTSSTTTTHPNKNKQKTLPELEHSSEYMDMVDNFRKYVCEQHETIDDECTTFGQLVAKKMRNLSEIRRDIMMVKIAQLFVDEHTHSTSTHPISPTP